MISRDTARLGKGGKGIEQRSQGKANRALAYDSEPSFAQSSEDAEKLDGEARVR